MVIKKYPDPIIFRPNGRRRTSTVTRKPTISERIVNEGLTSKDLGSQYSSLSKTDKYNALLNEYNQLISLRKPVGYKASLRYRRTTLKEIFLFLT